MSSKTVQYKRTLRGSVGAGVSALFNGDGRRYFILEHKDASKYHRAGESQKIIIDQIELGRAKECQVRFDESFPTVSRHHAAIIKDGDRWKLVQLSSINSTFLNGTPVSNEWYLENGDEIQLSVGGPRMGFIVPAGKQSLVSSIKMTERLELFRKQALRPYKTAIACLAVLLVLAIGGLGTWNILMQKDFDTQMAEAQMKLKKLVAKNKDLMLLQDSIASEQARLDSTIKAVRGSGGKIIRQTVVVGQKGGGQKVQKDINVSDLSKYEEDVFFLYTTKVVVTDGVNEFTLKTVDKKGRTFNYSWIGTGFLLDDGRFVTAKHCVEGWSFFNSIEDLISEAPNDSISFNYFLNGLTNPNLKIVAYINAQSTTKSFTFKSTDFIVNRNTEKSVCLMEAPALYAKRALLDNTDWAYVKTSQKGSIKTDISMVSKIPAGAQLTTLSFPGGSGAIDTNHFSCRYGSCMTARAGLDDGIIKISGRNFEPGSSGGPVFYKNNGNWIAVGIISSGKSSTLGGLVAISNIY